MKIGQSRAILPYSGNGEVDLAVEKLRPFVCLIRSEPRLSALLGIVDLSPGRNGDSHVTLHKVTFGPLSVPARRRRCLIG
jgi:hypothetical protein